VQQAQIPNPKSQLSTLLLSLFLRVSVPPWFYLSVLSASSGLSLVAQDPDPLEAQVDALIEKMREGVSERREATEKLVEIRKTTPRVLRILRLRANAEKDVRVRVRLEFVAGTRLLLWQWEAKEGTDHPAVAGPPGLAVHGSSIAFYDAKTGERRWELKASSLWARAPVFSGSKVWFLFRGDGKMHVRSVEVATGRVDEAGIVANDVERAFAVDGEFTAQLGVTSQLKFGREGKMRQIILPQNGRFALGGGKLFVYDGDQMIWAFDAATGKKLWKAEADQGLDYFGATAQAVVARCTRDRIRTYDTATGKELWRQEVPREDGRPPLMLTDDHCISTTPRWSCREILTGRELWAMSTGGADRPRIEHAHLWKNRALYVQDGKIHVVHLKSGGLEMLELPELPAVHRVIGWGDTLYVFALGGKLVAYKVME